MKYISEEQSAKLITHEIALEAAREAMIAAASGVSAIFPAVMAHGSDADDFFAIKSGATDQLAGLKIGSYWPKNDQQELPRHSSTIILLDQNTGRVGWVIEAGQVNAYRTAAVDAAAADALSRKDASTLVVFGAGHQAFYECLALSRVRDINRVLIVARDPDKGTAFANSLKSQGVNAETSDAQTACGQADIIVTATPSTSPLFEADWVQPGTHVVSMGSDSIGKQELPPELFVRASLFCDLPEQALRIGELQHYRGDADRLTPIGDVLTGKAAGRQSDSEITVFDSSGIALQDLCIAHRLTVAYEATG